MHKKRSSTEFNNYRACFWSQYSLCILKNDLEPQRTLFYPSIIMNIVLTFRNPERASGSYIDVQDLIFHVTQISEKTIETGGEVHLCFVDLE